MELSCVQVRIPSVDSLSYLVLAPMAIWGYKLPIEQLKELSFFETALTSPNEIMKTAVFCYRLSITHLLKHQGVRELPPSAAPNVLFRTIKELLIWLLNGQLG